MKKKQTIINVTGLASILSVASKGFCNAQGINLYPEFLNQALIYGPAIVQGGIFGKFAYSEKSLEKKDVPIFAGVGVMQGGIHTLLGYGIGYGIGYLAK